MKLSIKLPLRLAVSPNRAIGWGRGEFRRHKTECYEALKEWQRKENNRDRSSALLGVKSLKDWINETKKRNAAVSLAIEGRAKQPLDPDNLVAGCKFVIDTIKNLGFIKDDDYLHVNLSVKSMHVCDEREESLTIIIEAP